MQPLKLLTDAREFARRVSERLGALSQRHDELAQRQASMEQRLELLQEAIGRIEARQMAGVPFSGLPEVEFRAFSQWGEDGILQALTRLVPVPSRTFVEFGVQDYREANTRFLLVNCGWSGLVLECDAESVRSIRESRAYLNYPLQAVCAFVTRENIDALLREHGMTGEIGVLSVDVDGNDYWIWEAIEAVRPAIVVAEYNHRFGPERAVTIPYDPAFERSRAHPSRVYFGASLKALTLLGRRKGYDLVGCTSSGVNCFFVRSDLRPEILPVRTPEAAFVAGNVAEWRDAEGRQARVSREEEAALVFSLPLVDVSGAGEERPS